MDDIIKYAENQISNAQKKNYIPQLDPKDQILENLIRYEFNLEDECKDFCQLVNHQLSENQKQINSKLESFYDLSITEIREDNLKDVENDSKDDTPSDSSENDPPAHIKKFVENVKEAQDMSIAITELQLMMNCLFRYQNEVNTDFLYKEKKKIEHEKELLKSQKNRALDFLYEMQEHCADLLNFNS